MSALWSKQASDRILFWMPLSTPVQDAKRSRKPRSIRRAFGRSSPGLPNGLAFTCGPTTTSYVLGVATILQMLESRGHVDDSYSNTIPLFGH